MRWLETLKPPYKFFQREGELEAGEVGAQTEMVAESKPDARIGIPANVKPERFVEYVLVAVSRHLPDCDLVTGPDCLTGQLGIATGSLALVDRRRGPANNLLDCGAEQRRAVAKPPVFVRVFDEGLMPPAIAPRWTSAPAGKRRAKKAVSSRSSSWLPSSSRACMIADMIPLSG
ncbi:MAG: hypothetical protein R2706_03035 [Acidimicrobiales bacterium]